MEIKAAEFRINCFKILDRVRDTQQEIIITKRGKPIAKVVHIDQPGKEDLLLGALLGSGRTVGDLTEPVSDWHDWEID
jgi:prevent-host-death family protein